MIARTFTDAKLGLAVAALGAGCAQAPKPLYMWENFPRQQYETLLREAKSPQSQIEDMEAHAVKARGAHSALPPGFRAHLGMLYLNAGNAEKARELWSAEMAAFPESAPYMNKLLEKLDAAGAKPPAKSEGNPA